MSNNSECGSKRKREDKSAEEPAKLRRSARQKGKNQVSILERAMNLKRANSLESTSSHSTQTPIQASGETTNEVQPAPEATRQQIYQSRLNNLHSNNDQATLDHINNISEQGTSRLNPNAPEFHGNRLNSYPLQNSMQSPRNQESFMTSHNNYEDASRRVNQFHMAGYHHPISQAAQPGHVNPNVLPALNSQILSSHYDASRRFNQSRMAGSHHPTNQAAQAGQFDPNNVAAMNSQMIYFDASRRVNHPRMADSRYPSNQASQPGSSGQIDPNILGTLNSPMQSSQNEIRRAPRSQREATPAFSNSQRFFIPQGVPQGKRSSRYPMVDSSQFQANQFHPNITALNFQRNNYLSGLDSHAQEPMSRTHQSYSNHLRHNNTATLNSQMNFPVYGNSFFAQAEQYQMADSSNRNIDSENLHNNTSQHDYARFSNNGGRVAPSAMDPNLMFLDDYDHNSSAYRGSPGFPNNAHRLETSRMGPYQTLLENYHEPQPSIIPGRLNLTVQDRRNFLNNTLSQYDAEDRALLVAELRKHMSLQGQHRSLRESNDEMNYIAPNTPTFRKHVSNHRHKEKSSQQPIAAEYIRMKEHNPLSSTTPEPKLLGERCQLCRIDIGFKAKGENSRLEDPPFSAVLPCGHAYHDHCVKEFFGDVEPPCIKCLESQAPEGC